jgi:DNA-binding transcriptional LysR family regulator
MMTLKQLRHALSVARHHNFHSAAKAENISQPALSRSIQALEEQLGVQLFNRKGANVDPTPFGSAVLERARLVLGETDELLRAVQILKGVNSGSLRVAAGTNAAELSASRAIGELTSRYPGIDCRLKLTNWRDVGRRIMSRNVDLGIAEISTLEDNGELEIIPLAQHRVVLYVRGDHPLADLSHISVEDLADYPTVAPRLPPRAYGLFPGRTRLDRETGDVLPTIEVDDVSCARMVVCSSDAFSIATPVQIEPWLRTDQLKILDFHQPWLRLNYGIIYLASRMLVPAASVYIELVQQIEQEMSERNAELFNELVPL